MGEEDASASAPSWGWLALPSLLRRLTDKTRLRKVEVPVMLLGTETDGWFSAAAIRAQRPSAQGAARMLERAGHELCASRSVRSSRRWPRSTRFSKAGAAVTLRADSSIVGAAGGASLAAEARR